MQIISLYRYIRPDGGITVSPVKPEGGYTERYRLVADEGMLLTDGERAVQCIDVDTLDGWREKENEENELTDALAALKVMRIEK